ncbi:MAG: hypothetical protein JXB47_01020 [Anaerolineae bacterium]|nr:hypothetical protein [Anaerolineae bacterium]
MNFKPFDYMWERGEIAKDNSDDDYFNKLMYMGEMVTKFTAAAMVAAVNDGRDRQQYRLKYQLVRADGIGDWSRIIDDVLSGVPAQHLMSQAYVEARQLTERTSRGNWQYESVNLLSQCLKVIVPENNLPSGKIAGRYWFSTFAPLRNKTRGHGAVPSGKLKAICKDLHESVQIFLDKFCLFQRGWAYLSQTLKGKYRVTRWTQSADSLNFLKTREGIPVNLPEGIYINFSENADIQALAKVDIIYSDVDAEDFYLPNGGFDSKHFEVLSYITGRTRKEDAKPYIHPITDLPPSETQGKSEIEQRGGSIVNLPPVPNDYITREPPEHSLYEEIVHDNQHRIITLIGRGGIGKTWLALRVLNRIAEEKHFAAILWFSARDIDLLPDGAKQVKPHILTEGDIAEEFARLIAPYMMSYEELQAKDFNPVAFLCENMNRSSLGPILFVFDNFETVKSPVELYRWIDQYLRLPNKAVITTRFREFKGDYPVELRGMSFDECSRLIEMTAKYLNITNLLTPKYKEALFNESSGHPYIVKILLGEIKKLGRLPNIERVVVSQENILDTLFERTYFRLSPVAQRVFLTLCNWKSLVPQLAIEAVLLRLENEAMDVEQAIEDLSNSSLIERLISKEDDEIFLSVPLVAMQFGQRKLSVNRMKTAIQADTELLHFFGAAQETDVQHGLVPRIRRLIINVEDKVCAGNAKIQEYLPVLEFVARKYSPTWLMIADLYERVGQPSEMEKMLKKYLEFSDDGLNKRNVWRKLVRLYSRQNKFTDELFACLELIQLPDIDYETISDVANRFNSLMREPNFDIDDNEKNYVVKQLIDLMNSRIDEATATDCSRLGWLHMHYGESQNALIAAERGLRMDPTNEYCQKLMTTASKEI